MTEIDSYNTDMAIYWLGRTLNWLVKYDILDSAAEILAPHTSNIDRTYNEWVDSNISESNTKSQRLEADKVAEIWKAVQSLDKEIAPACLFIGWAPEDIYEIAPQWETIPDSLL